MSEPGADKAARAEHHASICMTSTTGRQRRIGPWAKLIPSLVACTLVFGTVAVAPTPVAAQNCPPQQGCPPPTDPPPPPEDEGDKADSDGDQRPSGKKKKGPGKPKRKGGRHGQDGGRHGRDTGRPDLTKHTSGGTNSNSNTEASNTSPDIEPIASPETSLSAPSSGESESMGLFPFPADVGPSIPLEVTEPVNTDFLFPVDIFKDRLPDDVITTPPPSRPTPDLLPVVFDDRVLTVEIPGATIYLDPETGKGHLVMHPTYLDPETGEIDAVVPPTEP